MIRGKHTFLFSGHHYATIEASHFDFRHFTLPGIIYHDRRAACLFADIHSAQVRARRWARYAQHTYIRVPMATTLATTGFMEKSETAAFLR